MIHSIKNGVTHFMNFHKGTVNIILHVIGFALLIYSIAQLNWLWIAVSILVIESGHIYNHIMNVQKYDTRLYSLFWRATIFLLFVGCVFILTGCSGEQTLDPPATQGEIDMAHMMGITVEELRSQTPEEHMQMMMELSKSKSE